MIWALPTSEDFLYAALPLLFMLDLCKLKFLMLFSHLLALEHTVPLYSSLHLANPYLPLSLNLIETSFSACYNESCPLADTLLLRCLQPWRCLNNSVLCGDLSPLHVSQSTLSSKRTGTMLSAYFVVASIDYSA